MTEKPETSSFEQILEKIKSQLGVIISVISAWMSRGEDENMDPEQSQKTSSENDGKYHVSQETIREAMRYAMGKRAENIERRRLGLEPVEQNRIVDDETIREAMRYAMGKRAEAREKRWKHLEEKGEEDQQDVIIPGKEGPTRMSAYQVNIIKKSLRKAIESNPGFFDPDPKLEELIKKQLGENYGESEENKETGEKKWWW